MVCSFSSQEDMLSPYRELFKKMLRENYEQEADNNSREHAKILIQELISVAQKEVVILCTHLSNDVYGNERTLNAIGEALNRGVQFHVYIRDFTPECQKCFNLLTNNGSKIYLGYRKKPEQNDFCVVDGIRYRRELNQNQGSAKVCAFGKDIAQQLVGQLSSSKD